MAEHNVVKPEKIVATAAGLLEQELILPNLFHKEGIDQFKGAKDDTINVVVPGVLPFREYAWRNDRSSGIVFDEYAERKISVTFGGNVYSAVKLTDEQKDFDIQDWGKLLTPQAKAVSRGLQRKAVTTLVGADYKVTVGHARNKLRAALIEARRVLNAFNVPDDQRILLVGSEFESAMLNDEKLTLAQNVGDARADSALSIATMGTLLGFRVVVDQTIPAGDAYAFVASGYIFASGAPSVPASVPFGATTSFEGIALRWVRDYDSEHMQDRSVVNTYQGFRTVEDVLVGWDDANNTEVVSADEHFVRGIRLSLDEDSVYPLSTGTTAQKELFTITGVGDTNAYPTAEAAS